MFPNEKCYEDTKNNRPIFSNASQLSEAKFTWTAFGIASNLLQLVKRRCNKQILETTEHLKISPEEQLSK